MKKFTTILIVFAMIGLNANATNVSGGIYSNTTWTLVNSPYIVTSTVVVFPGDTLTIESGVIVKFADGQQLEIRQGSIIASGTSTDSIIFTSNSNAPHAGIWSNIYLNNCLSSKFDYCSFTYAHEDINGTATNNDTVILRHSRMYNSDFGLYLSGAFMIDSCNIFNCRWGCEGLSDGCIVNYCNISNNTYDGMDIFTNKVIVKNSQFSCNGQDAISNGGNSHVLVENCNFENNQSGIMCEGNMNVYNCSFLHNSWAINNVYEMDSIYRCLFKYNTYGVQFGSGGSGCFLINNNFDHDSIGIRILNHQNNISCNVFQNNTYAIKYEENVNSNCLINNYWGTTDSATIETYIYDGYDNVSYGLLTFIPVETMPCANVGPTTFSTPIGCMSYESTNEINKTKNFISLFPNPATDLLTISLPDNNIKSCTINLYDLIGEKVIETYSTKSTQSTINLINLPQGIYFLEVLMDGEKVVRKVVKI